jgi:hypothetical protein
VKLGKERDKKLQKRPELRAWGVREEWPRMLAVVIFPGSDIFQHKILILEIYMLYFFPPSYFPTNVYKACNDKPDVTDRKQVPFLNEFPVWSGR